MRSLLFIYIFCFIFPFIYNIFDSGGAPSNWAIARYVLAGSTQIFFLSLEYAELKYNGIGEYFSDPWNYVDSSQFIIYIIRVTLEITNDPNSKVKD